MKDPKEESREIVKAIGVFLSQEDWNLINREIARIQSDAHRAGFSAGLEAGAALCDQGWNDYELDSCGAFFADRIRALAATATGEGK